MSLLQKGSKIKEFFLMTIGILIMVVGIYFFKFPNNFSFGGVTGIAVILSRYTAGFLTKGNIVLIFNVLLLIIGYFSIGEAFAFKTVYCSLLMSGALQVLEWVCPLKQPLTDEPVLELAFGVLLPALGSAILFNIGASSGGTDILAMIIKKHTDVDIGKGLMISDTALTLLTFVSFDIKTGLMSLLGLVTKSLVIDTVIEGINLCKYINIVCDDPEPILRYIEDDLNRSATVTDAMGAYSGKNKTMVLTVVTRRQAMLLKRYVHHIEPTAFIIITSTSEIIGKGFIRV